MTAQSTKASTTTGTHAARTAGVGALTIVWTTPVSVGPPHADPFRLPVMTDPGVLFVGRRNVGGRPAVCVGLFDAYEQWWALRPKDARVLADNLRAHAEEAESPGLPPALPDGSGRLWPVRRALSCNPPHGGWLQTSTPTGGAGDRPSVLLVGGPAVVLPVGDVLRTARALQDAARQGGRPRPA